MPPPLLKAPLLALAALFFGQAARAQIDIVERQGNVEVYLPRVQSWNRVTEVPWRVEKGDKIRTGGGSTASLLTPDGSKILLGASSEFTAESSAAVGTMALFKLEVGTLKAWVTKTLNRRFQVRTPTAVCSVRGTAFSVDVAASRATLIDVSEGVVGVKTLLGEEIELGDGRTMRSIRVMPDQPLERAAERAAAAAAAAAKPAAPAAAPKVIVAERKPLKRLEKTTAPRTVDDDFKKDVEREVALGQSKEAIQAAAAVESRRAEYQEGKTLIDAFGKRVRLEEYVVRPAADQFKLVALSERADRFDYFYYQARFNQTLPADLTAATRYLTGKSGAAPDYFITEFETGRSNTRDSVVEIGTGGHLVNSPLTADKVAYDGQTNTFTTETAGTAFWTTLFDNYSYKINGTEKYGWEPAAGANITSYDYAVGGIHTRILGGGADCALAGCAVAAPVNCTSTACENAARPSAITQPEGAGVFHDRVTITYAFDGTMEMYDFYVVSDEGRVATKADFSGVTSGARYKEKLVQHNFQQRIIASEFGGRSIDIVVEPKILIKAGVLQ
ncbi:MAG: FecR domain-containing protein [Elusimicrobia bacterium]|nr:FecR domain-containing protein [Elusimicrobiota bacterium]